MTLSPEGLAKSLKLLSPESSSNDVQEKQFRGRLRTFIEGQRWVHKPLIISPAVCARYGWKCVSSQLLECETCAAKLSPGQLKIGSFLTYKASVQKIQEGLKTSHKKLCPWPVTPCPESYVHMLPLLKEDALRQFKKRFESLITLSDQLPVTSDEVPQKLGLSEELADSVLELLNAEKNNASLSAICLAATGWRRDFEARQKKCLSCFQCQRTVALLLYTSVEEKLSKPDVGTKNPPLGNVNDESLSKDVQTDEQEEEQSSCDQKTTVVAETGQKRKISQEEEEESDTKENKMESQQCIKRLKLTKKPSSPFDPLFEHRPWCPWVTESVVRVKKEPNSSLSSDSKDGYITLPGWQLFVKCLLRNIKSTETNTSSLKEQIACVQDLLRKWSKPA